VSWPATNPSSVPGLRRASLRRECCISSYLPAARTRSGCATSPNGRCCGPASCHPGRCACCRIPTRYRIDLVGARPAEKQRVEKLLAMPASSCRWSPATAYLRGLRPGDTGCPDRRGTRPRGSRGHGPEPDAGYNVNVAHGGVLSGAGRTACPRQLRHSSLALERQILNLCRALLLDRRFR
jgi:hypothetical protein